MMIALKRQVRNQNHPASPPEKSMYHHLIIYPLFFKVLKFLCTLLYSSTSVLCTTNITVTLKCSLQMTLLFNITRYVATNRIIYTCKMHMFSSFF